MIQFLPEKLLQEINKSLERTAQKIADDEYEADRGTTQHTPFVSSGLTRQIDRRQREITKELNQRHLYRYLDTVR